MAPALLPSIAAKDLKRGHLILCVDPRCIARVKEASEAPDQIVELKLKGGDPKPAIWLRVMFMDGPQRGQYATFTAHPDDLIRMP